jgi:hypothetical protein
MASMDESGNITCTNNTTFYLYSEFYDKTNNLVNLTGFTAKMQVRTSKCDEDCSKLVIEFSTTNGRIALGGTAGTVIIQASAADMALLPVGQYYYDFILNTGSTEIDYFKGIGTFTIQGGITQ